MLQQIKLHLTGQIIYFEAIVDRCNFVEDNGVINFGGGGTISYFNSSRSTSSCLGAVSVDEDTFTDMRTCEGLFVGDLTREYLGCRYSKTRNINRSITAGSIVTGEGNSTTTNATRVGKGLGGHKCGPGSYGK